MKTLGSIVSWQLSDWTRAWILLMMYGAFLFAIHSSARPHGGDWPAGVSLEAEVALSIAIDLGMAMSWVYILLGPLIGLLAVLSFAYESETGITRTLLLQPVSKSAIYLGNIIYVYVAAIGSSLAAVLAYLLILDPKILTIVLNWTSLSLFVTLFLYYLALFSFLTAMAISIAIAFRRTATSLAVLITALFLLNYTSSVGGLGQYLPPSSLWGLLIPNLICIVQPGLSLDLLPVWALVFITVILFLASWYFFIRHAEWY